MITTITTKTLVPISIAGLIGIGSFYVSASNSKIEENHLKSKANEEKFEKLESETNKNYIEIIQRLTRIEASIKK